MKTEVKNGKQGVLIGGVFTPFDQTQPPQTDVAHEQTGRGLSFDGIGINGPDEYRTRIATFVNPNQDAKKYGPLFEASLDLLEACKTLLASWATESALTYATVEQAQEAIARAEGK